MKNCSHGSNSSPQGLTYWSQCRGGICKKKKKTKKTLLPAYFSKSPWTPTHLQNKRASTHTGLTLIKTHKYMQSKLQKKKKNVTRHFLYLTCLKQSLTLRHQGRRRGWNICVIISSLIYARRSNLDGRLFRLWTAYSFRTPFLKSGNINLKDWQIPQGQYHRIHKNS